MNGKPLRRPLARRPSAPPLLPPCTTKQLGDATEYLTAGMMTLAGIPTSVMPEHWPDYDLIAQPPGEGLPQRINVKSRREKVTYKATIQLRPDEWDWFAFVWVPQVGQPRYWIIPKTIVVRDMKSQANGERRLGTRTLERQFARFENNFALLPAGRTPPRSLATALPPPSAKRRRQRVSADSPRRPR